MYTLNKHLEKQNKQLKAVQYVVCVIMVIYVKHIHLDALLMCNVMFIYIAQRFIIIYMRFTQAKLSNLKTDES